MDLPGGKTELDQSECVFPLDGQACLCHGPAGRQSPDLGREPGPEACGRGVCLLTAS